jgi:hypothetical protein
MRWLLLVVLSALLLGGSAPAAPARAARCGAEDDPAWNWVRCGNGKRGVTNWSGKRVIVTRRTFCRVAIDWSRTRQLPGDPSC